MTFCKTCVSFLPLLLDTVLALWTFAQLIIFKSSDMERLGIDSSMGYLKVISSGFQGPMASDLINQTPCCLVRGCSRDKDFMHPPGSRAGVCKCLGICMIVNFMNWSVWVCVAL